MKKVSRINPFAEAWRQKNAKVHALQSKIKTPKVGQAKSRISGNIYNQ